MKRVDDYITNYEANKFCANCNEVCSRHCDIMRKAHERYEQDGGIMYTFEEGKTYEANDSGLSPVEIIKRTPKTCLVRNYDGYVWRMKIKTLDDSEIMTDSSVPKNWRVAYTYYAKFEVEGGMDENE